MMLQNINYDLVDNILNEVEQHIHLHGINDREKRDCFVQQILDSIKRVEYLTVIKNRGISLNRINPNSNYFDPLRAAIYHKNNNNIDEAFWCTFLYTLFGKTRKKGYGLLKAFYSRLGDQENIHSYLYTKQNIEEVKIWISNNSQALKRDGGFGNHRKYETLNATKRGAGSAIQSYLDIIGENHETFLNKINEDVYQDKYKLFDFLYIEFKKINSFSRLSSFDFVTMLGKVGLVPAEPGSAYLKDATGPNSGLKELLDLPNLPNNELDEVLNEIGKSFDIPFKMQILEDAICNWQKSKNLYKKFKG